MFVLLLVHFYNEAQDVKVNSI